MTYNSARFGRGKQLLCSVFVKQEIWYYVQRNLPSELKCSMGHGIQLSLMIYAKEPTLNPTKTKHS